MRLNKDSKILIVGLGLIGGSYADGLTANGFEVGAIDADRDSISYAVSNGLIQHGRSEIDGNYIGMFDVIIFALYPHVLIDWLKENQKYIKKNALLTDTTGIKRSIVYDIQNFLRDDLEFIGAHPMAGREKSGVKNASRIIFGKANYIVTPTENNTECAIEKCEDIGKILGFCHITRLSPEKHDEMIAFLSQLTHCIAVSLMTCRDCENFVEYTGDSFRDLTRIAKINDAMWSELFLLNKDELLGQMDCFEKQFHALREHIANDDVENIKKIMRDSTHQREIFDIEKSV